MVVAELKPLPEILEMIADCSKIVLAGCHGCVTECQVGGEKEVQQLAAALTAARRNAGSELQILEYVCDRQCEPQCLEPLDDLVMEADALLSLACNIGPQLVAARYPYLPVYPGTNTLFIGGAVEPGVWREYCQACGSCIIGEFGGLCPIARCAKQLLNGPCGGSQEGLCEVGRGAIECVWHLIFERLKNLKQLRRLEKVAPCKDWSTSHHGGPRFLIREELTK